MKFGLTQDQYKFIQTQVVHPLEKLGAKVWCYGSRARGDYRHFSDLDLMVETSHDISNSISQLQEFLVESNFPYKVDLVKLNDFADSYRNSFEQDKVLF